MVSEQGTSLDTEGCLARLVSALLIAFLWSLTIVTLPVSGWWTLRKLPQWQRMVVFRLGKALPVRGPGWTVLLPVLDRYESVDLRNRAILVPPQQLITSDGGVVELGAEVLYRVCDPSTFVGSCSEPDAVLRSLSRGIFVSTLSKQQVDDITRKGAQIEEAILLSINSHLKDWGMEASSVKLSEVKIYKEPEHLPSVGPVLRQLGSMFGGGSDFSPMVAGQPPLSASWSPPDASAALPAADGTTADAGAAERTAAMVKQAVARLPVDVGIAAGSYRIETTEPAATFVVNIANDHREVLDVSTPAVHDKHLPASDVTVMVTSSDLRQLMSGQLSPVQAYSDGRLHAQGNIHLLMALGNLLKQ